MVNMYIFNKLLNDKQKQLTKNPINFSISKIKLISINPESDLIKPFNFLLIHSNLLNFNCECSLLYKLKKNHSNNLFKTYLILNELTENIIYYQKMR